MTYKPNYFKPLRRIPISDYKVAERINVLFVCSKNQWRSPTGESIYRDDPRLAVRSRGTASSARQTIRSADLSWADLVLVMDQAVPSSSNTSQ